MTTIHRMDSIKHKVKNKPVIDPDGLYQWKELSQFLPVSRDFWRRLVNAKKAPTPLTIGSRSKFWRGEDVIEWLQNPESYAAQ